MAGPVDARLVQFASGVRKHLVAYVAVSAVTALLVVAQAFTLGALIPRVFLGGEDLNDVKGSLMFLMAVVLGRVVMAGLGDLIATAAAVKTSSELRTSLLRKVVQLGPVWLSAERRTSVATLATRGIESIEPYVARYIPSLIIAVVVPLTVGVAILTQDLLAAVIVAFTAPLIPVFMILIGKYTHVATAKQWSTLNTLAGHFLDVVAGLPTLKAFGRENAQQKRMIEIDDRYRTTTMGVLRISFLSSFVLELLATVSVAVVAVSIGLRLIGGDLDLQTGLTVLILAPEVYLPIRMVGTHFHAAADGMSAAEDVFGVLEQAGPMNGVRRDVPSAALSVRDVSAAYPDRADLALAPISFVAQPGLITVITGPSGSGKSTLLAVLEGFLAPITGSIAVGVVDVRELDREAWLANLAVVQQDPVLLGPTIGDDIRLGRPDAPLAAVIQALRSVGLDADELALGAATPVGDMQSDVSAGQRRRISLARVLLSPAPIILLDEPTAGLDEAGEIVAIEAIRRLAQAGSVVIVVAHRPALIAASDTVVALERVQVIT